jgi:hypothetical protein
MARMPRRDDVPPCAGRVRSAPKYRDDSDWNWADVTRNRALNEYYGVPVI